jgi:hypothetical protein
MGKRSRRAWIRSKKKALVLKKNGPAALFAKSTTGLINATNLTRAAAKSEAPDWEPCYYQDSKSAESIMHSGAFDRASKCKWDRRRRPIWF